MASSRYRTGIPVASGTSGVAAMLLAAMALSASQASAAPPGIAVAVQIGASTPISSAIQHDVRLVDLTASSTGDAGTPVIVDHTPAIGAVISAIAQFGSLDARYTLRSHAWDSTLGDCVGTGRASVLSNGEIDDTGIDYRCGRPAERFEVPRATSSTLTEQSVTLNARWYYAGTSWVEAYLVGGGGFTLRTTDIATRGSVNALGGVLDLGAGADVPIEGRWSVALEARYGFELVAASSSSNRTARARSRGAGVLGSLTDRMQRLELGLLVRLSLD
jgi:hypothetical protein